MDITLTPAQNPVGEGTEKESQPPATQHPPAYPYSHQSITQQRRRGGHR